MSPTGVWFLADYAFYATTLINLSEHNKITKMKRKTYSVVSYFFVSVLLAVSQSVSPHRLPFCGARMHACPPQCRAAYSSGTSTYRTEYVLEYVLCR